jgi:hypothetical protein
MYFCSICKCELKHKTSVYIHVKSFLHKDNIKAIERNKQFLYRCELCEYYTDNKKSFQSHEKTKYHLNGTGYKYLS